VAAADAEDDHVAVSLEFLYAALSAQYRMILRYEFPFLLAGC
jgi:hypothetical protein